MNESLVSNIPAISDMIKNEDLRHLLLEIKV